MGAQRSRGSWQTPWQGDDGKAPAWIVVALQGCPIQSTGPLHSDGLRFTAMDNFRGQVFCLRCDAGDSERRLRGGRANVAIGRWNLAGQSRVSTHSSRGAGKRAVMKIGQALSGSPRPLAGEGPGVRAARRYRLHDGRAQVDGATMMHVDTFLGSSFAFKSDRSGDSPPVPAALTSISCAQIPASTSSGPVHSRLRLYCAATRH